MNKFSAAQYRRQRNERKTEGETFDVEMPSGAIFTLRRPTMTTYVASGEIPGILLEKMALLERKSSKEAGQVFAEMSAREQAQMTVFLGALVRETLVCPRISDDPQSDDEIRFSELEDDDFLAVVRWAKTGGASGESAGKFRRKSANPT